MSDIPSYTDPTDAEASPSLREMISLADQTFWRCRSTCLFPNGEDFPSLALYNHIIRMADGVEILSTAKAPWATFPLLRSMLESLLSLEYIHQAHYRKRSLAWLCGYVHQEIKHKEGIDLSTDMGKCFQQELGNQQRYWADDLVKPNTTSAEVKRLKMMLEGELLRDSEHEYQDLKSQKKSSRWYSFDDGPHDLYDLAKKVGWIAYYRVFYQPWSASVHGTDAANLLLGLADGSADFKDLRDEHGLQFGLHGAVCRAFQY